MSRSALLALCVCFACASAATDDCDDGHCEISDVLGDGFYYSYELDDGGTMSDVVDDGSALLQRKHQGETTLATNATGKGKCKSCVCGYEERLWISIKGMCRTPAYLRIGPTCGLCLDPALCNIGA